MKFHQATLILALLILGILLVGCTTPAKSSNNTESQTPSEPLVKSTTPSKIPSSIGKIDVIPEGTSSFLFTLRMPSDTTYYFMASCTSMPEPLLLYREDNAKWEKIQYWESDLARCVDVCENNKQLSVPKRPNCSGACPVSVGCMPLVLGKYSSSEVSSSVTWYKKIVTYQNGTCGDKTGEFGFVENAPKGRYKLSATYFADSLCQQPKQIETIFEVS